MSVDIKDVNNELGNLITMSGIITESEFVVAMQRHLSQDPEKKKEKASNLLLTQVGENQRKKQSNHAFNRSAFSAPLRRMLCDNMLPAMVK